MRGKWLALLLAATVARAEWLYTGVDAARLCGVPQVRQQVVHVWPSDTPALVACTRDGVRLAEVGVYPSVADAAEVCAAFERLASRPVEHPRLRLGPTPDWVGRGEVAAPDSHEPRLGLRWRNLVCFFQGPTLAGVERCVARLADPAVAARGESVPVPRITAWPDPEHPFRTGRGGAELSYVRADPDVRVLSAASSTYEPGRATAVVQDGQEEWWACAVVNSVATFDQPGRGRQVAWFATERNVVCRVAGEFTVQPWPGHTNAWLEALPTREPHGNPPADMLEVAVARADLLTVGFVRRAGCESREVAGLEGYVSGPWLPPAKLAYREVHHSAGLLDRPAWIARCDYSGGRVRLSWRAEGGAQLLYVEQDLPPGATGAEVAAREIFRPRARVRVLERVEAHPLAGAAEGQRVMVYLLRVPRPWWRRGWAKLAALVVLLVGLRRGRRWRARARQGF